MVFPASGHAAEAGAAAGRGLEEVVVTATKREESIQKIPVSISAVSGEQLAEMQAADVKDLGKFVPGLQLRTEYSLSTPFAFIRGVGNYGFVVTSISPVGFYSDGIYIGQNIAQGLQLFDLERIEVLRGPQGTLFGRNTTGGLINVISRKPRLGAGTNGEFKITAGDYGTLNLNAAFGSELGETAAFRIALSRQSDDGVFRNVNPDFTGDRDVGDTDADGARAQLLWEPTDSLSALFRAHWGKSDGGMVINKAGWLANADGTNCPAGAITGALYNGCSDPYGFGLTETNGWFESGESFAGAEEIDSHGFSAELNWTLGDYTLTSVSAWDAADVSRLQDADGAALAFMHATFIADTSYWSQELRLASNYTGPWNWLAGVYYYGDRNRSFANFAFGDLGGTGIGQSVRQETESYAIFADINYRFAERWTLSAGFRWTSDQRTTSIETWLDNAAGVIGAPAAPPSVVPVLPANVLVTESMARAAFLAPLIPYSELERTWREPSGRVSLSYAIDDDRLLYGTVSRGFKGGEFNGVAIISPEEVSLTNPEYITSYELGVKSSWLDSRLRANVAIFYMDYEDQQVMTYLSPDAVFPALSNVGASEISGVEFELEARPGTGWALGLSGSYLDATVKDFFDPVLGNRAGNRLNDAPKWSFSGFARYEHALPKGTLSVQAQGSWSAFHYFQIENQPGLFTKSYGTVDARAAYTFRNDSMEIGIFAKNLLDKGYSPGGFDLNAFGAMVFQMGRPRLVGADFTYRFD